MYQSVGGFVLGAIAALLLFFFFPGVLDGLRDLDWSFGHREVDVGLVQPFAIAGGNPLDADDVWSDAPAARCQGVLAVENRSRDPLNVSMAARYRDVRNGGALAFPDGQDRMELAPGTEIDRAIADSTISDPVACEALNARGALVIQAEICPDTQDARPSDCRDIEIDPAQYAGDPARRGGQDRDGHMESQNLPPQDDAAPPEEQ